VALAAALVRLANNSNEAKQMGSEGVKMAQRRFSANKQIQLIQAIYEGLESPECVESC
jgi:glycosyltransferase involved in cell wall biosynthesis